MSNVVNYQKGELGVGIEMKNQMKELLPPSILINFLTMSNYELILFFKC